MVRSPLRSLQRREMAAADAAVGEIETALGQPLTPRSSISDIV